MRARGAEADVVHLVRDRLLEVRERLVAVEGFENGVALEDEAVRGRLDDRIDRGVDARARRQVGKGALGQRVEVGAFDAVEGAAQRGAFASNSGDATKARNASSSNGRCLACSRFWRRT
ncbi:MAG TPA: hypothetical protein VI670_23150 [Thermoanaerobaculia bacterium]